MRKKYSSCTRIDGDCSHCEKAITHTDCNGKAISSVEWFRRRAGLEQKELSEKSGVGLKQIQKMEYGTASIGQIAFKNASAIATALGIKMEELLSYYNTK